MKYKVLKVINILLLLFTVSLFIYELAFAKERNVKLMVKAGTVSLIFLLSFLRIRPKRSPFDKYIYNTKNHLNCRQKICAKSIYERLLLDFLYSF